MSAPHAQVLEQLAAYVIDGEAEALEAACATLHASAMVSDVDALMQGLAALKGQRADASRLALAERRLRGALGLSMHAGAICRPSRPM